MLLDDQFVWVFTANGHFPGGVFSAIETAEQWIARHTLSGVLTKYPLDEGCWDWAMRKGITNLRKELHAEKAQDPAFIGGFTTASQEHYHYEAGERVS